MDSRNTRQAATVRSKKLTGRTSVDKRSKTPAAESEASAPRGRGSSAAARRKVTRSNSKTPAQRSSSIHDIWVEYKETGAVGLRNELAVHYMPLVRTTAERIRSRLPAIVEVDDLSSSGMFGLMCAIDSYDMHQGAKFETFCAKRVRGAIFDNIRALDPASRLARRRESQVAKIRESFRKLNGRDISEDELRDRIDATPEERERIVRDSRVPLQASLSAERAGPTGETMSVIDSIEGRREEGVTRLMQRGDLQDWLTKGLTPAERLVVLLYYYENMTMREIGVVLGRSESRVSQMHSLILARLKSRLRGSDHEFEITS